MYPIKLRFWTGCLLTSLVCLPSGFVNQTKVLAVEPVVQIAQKSSAYKEYMLRGYQLTRLKNYKGALRYFEKAREIRRNDRYAITAIGNLNSYIARGTGPSDVARGNPGRKSTGATRSLNLAMPFALIHSDEKVPLTTAEHPTFFFYIPELPQNKRKMKFVLRETTDAQTTKILYQTTFTPVGTKGIVSVSIPEDQPPLKIGKEYEWTLIFDRKGFGESIIGTIQRVQDETIADLIQQTINPLDQATTYEENGFLENSLSILANLRRQRPNDPNVQQSWTDFLKSVDLEAVANEPLL